MRFWWFGLMLLMAGCGFQLRGYQAPLELDTIYVSGGSEQTRLSLEQSLSRAGVDISDVSPLHVRLSGERQWKRTNVVDKQGRAAGYEMRHSLNWELRRADGLLLIPSSNVLVTQSINIDPTNALATTDEEHFTQRQMRDRLIEQFNRQLNTQMTHYRDLIQDALSSPESP